MMTILQMRTEPWEKTTCLSSESHLLVKLKSQTPNLLGSSSLLLCILPNPISMLRLRPSSYFPQRHPQIPFSSWHSHPSALFGIWLWSQLETFLNHHLWLHNTLCCYLAFQFEVRCFPHIIISLGTNVIYCSLNSNSCYPYVGDAASTLPCKERLTFPFFWLWKQSQKILSSAAYQHFLLACSGMV